MNGPEHYNEAERLLNRITGSLHAPSVDLGIPISAPQLANLLSRVEAHTRLAELGAMIDMAGRDMASPQLEVWHEALYSNGETRG